MGDTASPASGKSAETSADPFLVISDEIETATSGLMKALETYETEGPDLAEKLKTRLEPLTNESRPRALEVREAANDLVQSWRVSVGDLAPLTGSIAILKLSMESLVDGMAIKYMKRVMEAFAAPVSSGMSSPIEALEGYMKGLSAAVDDSQEWIYPTVTILADSYISALGLCSDHIMLRLQILRSVLSLTEPPNGIQPSALHDPSTGKTIGRSAAAEVLFTAAEEAVKRVPQEVAAQVPLLSIAVSGLRIVQDVRKERKHIAEAKDLRQQIADAAYDYDIKEGALDLRRSVKEQDHELVRLVQSVGQLTDEFVNL